MPRGNYHHGNLKQALVDAASQLIEEKGPQAFTLADAARIAGVTAAAVYRHFSGREDLLEEVARQGFELFTHALTLAYREGTPTALSAIQRMGEAYLQFAREHRGFYMAMFESGQSFGGASAAGQAANQAHNVLLKAAEGLFVHLPPAERPPAMMVANHIWAMSHGVVELFARNRGATFTSLSPGDILESGVLVYLRGLGLIPA